MFGMREFVKSDEAAFLWGFKWNIVMDQNMMMMIMQSIKCKRLKSSYEVLAKNKFLEG